MYQIGFHPASILTETESYDELNDMLEKIRSYWLPEMDMEWDIDYCNFHCAFLYRTGWFEEIESLLKVQSDKAEKNSYIWEYWKSVDLPSSILNDRNDFEEGAALLKDCIRCS